MRRFKPEEFYDELLRRECKRLDDEDDENGTYWRFDGKVFQVPPPPDKADPQDPRYPDWMLDDILQVHGLPAKAKKPN